jgi:hypothetical protein
MQAGADPFGMMEKLRADATGNLLYLRVADGSSEGGVVWAEPDLTIPYLQSRVADFTQPVIDALVRLSAPISHPFGSVTAADCLDAWRLDELQTLLDSLQEQFDAIKNMIGTAKQPQAAVLLRAMADSVEAE